MKTTPTEKKQTRTVIWNARNIRNSVERIKRNEAQSGWNEICNRSSGIPLEAVIYVTPAVLDGNDLSVAEEALCCTIAFTRDLSRRRICFSHDTPLEMPHVIVTFDLIDDEPVSLLIEITWQRCRWDAWYLTGGKLLGVVEPPDFLP